MCIRDSDTAIGDLVDGAPVALDTLNELAVKLQGEETELNALILTVDGKQDTLTFDDAPVDGSANPVKSGGLFTALAAKQANLTFDTVPTDGSSNPVESNGVFDALANKQGTLGTGDVTNDMLAGSIDQSKITGLNTALAGTTNADNIATGTLNTARLPNDITVSLSLIHI